MVGVEQGLNWERWQRIATTVEGLGFTGLFRSDHFTDKDPPDPDSLELWISLTWLGSHSSHLEFGPLVSPMSFRHPAMTAKMAAAVDDLSNGRLVLGLGAGWQEREHTMFGLDLLDMDARFARFEEGLKVIRKLLVSDEPVTFDGDYYRLQNAILLPRPERKGGPPLLIGGNGSKRTLPLAARYAQEWNSVYLTPARLGRLNQRLDQLLAAEGRSPRDVRRSMMARCIIGEDDDQVVRKLAAAKRGRLSRQEALRKGWLVGTRAEVAEQLGALEESGLDHFMLHWLELDDLQDLEEAARVLLPLASV